MSKIIHIQFFDILLLYDEILLLYGEILHLYADDIVLLARCRSDLDKKLPLLKYFYSTMVMTVNIDKTKVMINQIQEGHL